MFSKTFNTILALGLAFTQYSFAQYSPKQSPPGGLEISNTPQFVIISFDDNNNPSNIQWLVDTLNTYSNPIGSSRAQTHDGQKVPAAWYNISNSFASQFTWDVMRGARDLGHEIGNHTMDHNTNLIGFKMTTDEWRTTISVAHEVHTAPYPSQGMGIPDDEVTGFRAPRLETNDSLYQILAELGYQYDTSLEDGYQDSIDGTNFLWPYKLIEGGGEGWDKLIEMSLEDENTDNDRELLKSYPNLWEIPLSPWIMTDSLDELFAQRKSWYKAGTNKITGFDWNVWDASFNTNDLALLLKTTLDLRLQGNRAPFMVGLHSDNYYNGGPKSDGVFEFIQYALQQPDVRFVTPQQLIDWLNNPVGLDGTSSLQTNKTSSAFNSILENKVLRLQKPLAETSTLSVYDSQGKLALSKTVEASSIAVPLDELDMGVYHFKLGQTSFKHIVH